MMKLVLVRDWVQAIVEDHIDDPTIEGESIRVLEEMVEYANEKGFRRKK